MTFFLAYVILTKLSGPVVQLVRMPACHAGGRGFEPHPSRQHASVAQSVEQGTENPCVDGSIPSGGTIDKNNFICGSGSVVERHLAKVNVASSNLVFRSKKETTIFDKKVVVSFCTFIYSFSPKISLYSCCPFQDCWLFLCVQKFNFRCYLRNRSVFILWWRQVVIFFEGTTKCVNGVKSRFVGDGRDAFCGGGNLRCGVFAANGIQIRTKGNF